MIGGDTAGGKIFPLGWTICTALLLAACSNQQIYHAVQQNRLNNCEKYPGPAYEDCIADYSKPYGEYQRERRELLRGQQPE